MFDIPKHFRLIIGLDPAATIKGWWGGVLLAIDLDNKDVYVVREYLKNDLTYAEHSENIRNTLMKDFSDRIPVICDPAGGGEDTQTRLSALEYLEQRSGFNIAKAYKARGVKETAWRMVYDLRRNKKLHISPTCAELLKEFDKYSMDENYNLTKMEDSILDAMFYALTQKDNAISMNEIEGSYSGDSCRRVCNRSA